MGKFIKRESVESVVRPNKIFTADESIILYSACKINLNKMTEIINSFINIFKYE